VHLTLGILRKSQAVFYALSFFWLDGFAVPRPSAGNANRSAANDTTNVKSEIQKIKHYASRHQIINPYVNSINREVKECLNLIHCQNAYYSEMVRF
jgi:hypothetical protein